MHDINLPSVSYGAGIKTARTWMPNFLFWLLTSGIRIFSELSVTFISPLNFFPRSRHERTQPSVMSFHGGSSDETDRFLRSRYELFEGIPRRVHSPSPIL